MVENGENFSSSNRGDKVSFDEDVPLHSANADATEVATALCDSALAPEMDVEEHPGGVCVDEKTTTG